MKRHARSFHRLLCALTLFMFLSMTLFLFACNDDSAVAPPNTDGGSTVPPGDSTGSGDQTDNTGNDPGNEPGNEPGGDNGDTPGDDTDTGIPKEDTDPDGGNYGEIQPFSLF